MTGAGEPSRSRGATGMRALALGCAGLVLLVPLSCLVGVALQPDGFRIARSRTVRAPQGEARALVADVGRFQPTLALDEALGPVGVVTRSPETTGVGAWFQTDRAGHVVRMTLSEIESDHVTYDVGVVGAGSSRLRIELAPAPDGTQVTYASEGDLDTFPKRALWPFVDLEGRIAPELEHSLEQLDAALRTPR